MSNADRPVTADLEAARRALVDAALRPVVLDAPPEGAGAPMTARRVAAAAREAAAAVLPLLGEPARSGHRVRRAIVPVLTCGWAQFDATYAEVLDALLALPPAVPGVEDPAWDEGLVAPAAARPSWLENGQRWVVPGQDAETVGPGGTAGRVARRASRYVLVTGDGRPVRMGVKCECAPAERVARPEVPFEQVHLRRDGSILDVTVGTACGACRAPVG